ncbi:MAG TPA: glycoside hydrolase family 13 protein, partial [Lapillicoccus sp.]|nr:glycoside hydrolase family 13 protein [Lapillicoccus sp.]
LPGITARLPYLRDLGVDAIWVSPFYRSPMADAGYDVADYESIDPVFGKLSDAEALIARAHQLGLKVVVDLVPNHTSDEHSWFRAALAAAPGSPERARYIFRDGKGHDGNEPPNNWPSVFGGIAWTRVTEADGRPGQWYLHLFDRKQPDLNWANLQVRAEFLDILRFWLDRGVAGFRVDVAHGLVKDPALPDWHGALRLLDSGQDDLSPDRPRHPFWDQDGVHEIYEEWRQVLDEYDEPTRVLCGEAWVQPVERLMRYVRPTEMHQSFNFDFLECAWDAPQLVTTISESLAAAASVGAPTTWVLSNHDVVRHASRLGLPRNRGRINGIRAEDPQPDTDLGLRRARAATTLMLGLPGAAYLYQGEELGLPDATTLPDEVRQDPAFLRTGGAETGRDGCRIPFPWSASGPSLGFGPTEATWLPQPAGYRDLAVDRQEGVPGSTLELYRRLLEVRRSYALGSGALQWLEAFADDPHIVAYRSKGSDREDVSVLVNLGAAPVALPAGVRVLVASGELAADGALPTDTAVWFTD